MIEVNGKYNSAKIYTDVVDQASIAQVITLCSQEFAQGSRIRMMPDIHAGKGCTVGTTMTISGKVCPNLVGVDIGCGMETVRLREDHFQPQQLDKLIRQKIPSGFAIREKPFNQTIGMEIGGIFRQEIHLQLGKWYVRHSLQHFPEKRVVHHLSVELPRGLPLDRLDFLLRDELFLPGLVPVLVQDGQEHPRAGGDAKPEDAIGAEHRHHQHQRPAQGASQQFFQLIFVQCPKVFHGISPPNSSM